MASNTVKCRACGTVVSKDTAVLHPDLKRYYFCNVECMDDYDSGNRSHVSDYTKLTDYIQELHIKLGCKKEDINWGMIGKQLEYLKSQHKFKDTGMLLTLKYYCDILNKNISPDTGVQYPIIYYYQAAKDYYVQTKHCEELSESFEPDVVQTIGAFPFHVWHNPYLIDLNDL